MVEQLAVYEPESVRKNVCYIGEYGRYDDLLILLGTPCEETAMCCIEKQLQKDMTAMTLGENVSLLAKWLPSVNASSEETVQHAKYIARRLRLSDSEYRKILSRLRVKIRILENNLRERDYTFDYEKQPSRALYKYRKAFLRNDEARYVHFMQKAETKEVRVHTGALTPYDVIAPVITAARRGYEISEEERRVMNTTWEALENFAGDERALAVVDGSGSMYVGESPLPAAVAQSLGIYFAERNSGCFHNHFITFSTRPQLVEIKGRDIAEKVRYCMGFNECSNTDLEAVFRLILETAAANHLSQEELPSKLYIISDMEFDCCSNADLTNFENAGRMYEEMGYQLPKIIFWNVASRNQQQPVQMSDAGAALVSGAAPQIFRMLQNDVLDPYHFMLEVLDSERYACITA
jgi:hypothetical protein